MKKRSSWFLKLISCFLFFTFQLAANTIIKEISPCGFSLEAQLDEDKHIREIVFSDESRVLYEYIDTKLFKITRYDSYGNELYSQTYNWDGTKLISQTGWFTTQYVYDDNDRIIGKFNPWHQETIEYDSLGNAIRIGDKSYSYDDMGQITAENKVFHAVYDNAYNLIEFNGNLISIDEQNKIKGHEYDLNGNLLMDGLIYDHNNLLIDAYGERFLYDVHGRLAQKGDTCFLYLGCEEIASFENRQCKTLKIPGIGGPIAIEIKGKPYAPIVDSAGIIRKLIDPLTNTIYAENECDIFGGGLIDAIPYAYRGKRYDPSTGLIYFGTRFYNPSLHRWISPDPLGPIDHENLYQYAYNNPLKYFDPTGGSLWGYVLGIGEIVAGGALMVGGAGVELATFGGFTFGFTIVEGSGFSLITDGLLRATREAHDLQAPWDKNHVTNTMWSGTTKKPPRFNGKDLGQDPSKCPEEGFEWKGRGSPESGKGNWYNPETDEHIHPDLEHPPGKAPHWGYDDPNGTHYDLFLDGSWQ